MPWNARSRKRSQNVAAHPPVSCRRMKVTAEGGAPLTLRGVLDMHRIQQLPTPMTKVAQLEGLARA